MTVVDTRRGRSSSGQGARSVGVGGVPGATPPRVAAPAATRVRVGTSGSRPGAGTAALLGLVISLCGVAVGAVLHDPAGLPAFLGYCVGAPVAAGAVRRGPSLRRLVLCLPLVFLAAVVVGAVLEVVQGGTPFTARTAGLTMAEVAVLHAPWLWAGTALAALVALRRRGPARG